jgi:tetratricopeptide (TPR) repeat protein
MTTPAVPSDSKPAGDDRNLVAVDESYVALSLEDRLHLILKNHSRTIIAACVVAVLAILAWGAWDLAAGQREAAVEKDYAAANTSEKLKSFAAANAGHPLAGVAQLRIADEAYSAGKYADAVGAYEAAATILKTGPFAGRAHLGAAMARLGLGKTTEGEATLRQISGDTGQLKGLRAEATYDLASLAADAGQTADVMKLSDQLMQIDPSSQWTQRGLALRARLPAPAMDTKPGAASPALPAISIKPDGK